MTIGYDFFAFGADITGVALPDFWSVPDPEGYTVEVGGGTHSVNPSEILDFSALDLAGITAFTIRGIGPSLGLDPTDDMAFATGLFFEHYDPDGSVYVDQIPITARVPVPAPAALVLAGLAGLGWVKQRA